jgi:uncharacterized repeat protein (TIGR04138 family)
MQKPNFGESVDEIINRDNRFDRDAYYFVREGLDFTLKMLKKQHHTQAIQRHVSGPELLEGLRRFALDQFGPMAKTVFDYWGVRRCEDFGEIVFNMVEKGILGKTEQDSREDFRGGFDFDEAFVKPFRPSARPDTLPTGRRVTPVREHNRASDSKKLSSGSN